jgi:hypothetical protein
VYLMFPLMFLHYPGPANDGLLEPRLLVSRDGLNFSYIGERGRDAFVPRGAGVHRPGKSFHRNFSRSFLPSLSLLGSCVHVVMARVGGGYAAAMLRLPQLKSHLRGYTLKRCE